MTRTQILSKRTYKTEGRPLFKVKEYRLIVLCLLAIIAAHSNIHLLSLPIIFMQVCRENQSRNICAVMYVVYLGINAVSNIMFVPYISFVFIYIIAEHLLADKKRVSVYAALITFAAVKGYVLSFGFSEIYTLVFAVEAAAFLTLPQMIQSGFSLLKNNLPVMTSLQLAECAAVYIAVALALSGIKIWGIDIPLCFLMSLCFLFSSRDNIPLSMLASVTAVLSQWQHENFEIIFAGFFLIGFASFALLQKGLAGYCALLAVSLGVTIAFIRAFNSFVFIVTTAVALTACFIFLKHNMITVKKAERETVGENDYLTLMYSVDKLGSAFRFLGNTVTDISNIISKDEVPKEVQQIAAEEICKKCRNNHMCWQQNYDHTQQQFSSFEHALWNNKTFEFDDLFRSVCDKTEQLKSSFVSAHRLLATKRLINQAGRHQQQMLQSQFLAMAQTLQDIVYHSGRRGIANTAITHTVNNFLLAMGKKVNYCICYQNNSRCVISTADYFSPSESDRIRIKLESMYNTKFAQPQKENDSMGILYTFSEIPQYKAEISYRYKSRYRVCGDICETFSADEYTYIILTDGMGTGSFAAAESRTAVAMLKSLMSAGIKPQTAMDIANTALNLKGTGQSCVALDILQINCYSGNTVLYKAGGAPSVLISDRKSRKMYRDSLPIGILKDTRTANMEFAMKNGDMVILMSDGVNGDKYIEQKVVLMSEKSSPENLADYILSCQDNADDATVAVVKLVRS